VRASPVLVIACGLAAACGGGGGATPVANVEATRDLGPLAFLPVIRDRDGGFSVGWAGRSVWDFGDTVLASTATDGETWRSSTSARRPISTRRTGHPLAPRRGIGRHVGLRGAVDGGPGGAARVSGIALS
jgi:hypothetical protein